MDLRVFITHVNFREGLGLKDSRDILKMNLVLLIKEMNRFLTVGGMKRRLLIAKAWHMNPKSFLEPTAGAYVSLRRDIWK